MKELLSSGQTLQILAAHQVEHCKYLLAAAGSRAAEAATTALNVTDRIDFPSLELVSVLLKSGARPSEKFIHCLLVQNRAPFQHRKELLMMVLPFRCVGKGIRGSAGVHGSARAMEIV